MKTIYKYTVTGLPLQNKIEMPMGATILSVNMQGADFCMWALVDYMSYVGTCFAEDGYAWHIMEVV